MATQKPLYPAAHLPRVPSPPCGIATGTPIFANAPYEVENVELKEKGLNF
jgi:hypothetical protein